MTQCSGLNECLERYNVLTGPASRVVQFLENNPTAYKIATVFAHLFRAAMMAGFMLNPYIPMWVSMTVCFVGSLFYRMAIEEKKCIFKIALPAFAGAVSIMIALPALISIIQGVAFASAGSAILCCLSFVPLVLYGVYVGVTVNYDVNEALAKLQQNTCCTPQVDV